MVAREYFLDRAAVLALIDEHERAASDRFDAAPKTIKGAELQHEANGAMTALRALKRELLKVPVTGVKAPAKADDSGDGGDDE